MSDLKSRSKFHLVLLLLLLPALVGCGRIFKARSAVGVLSAALPNVVSTNGISSIAQEQDAGYELLKDEKDNRLTLNFSLENDPKNEIQVSVRNFAQDPSDPVIAILGATSNDATMQVAGLVNFFNIPMIIPTVDGNTLIPSNNLWVFRLSAPSSAYSGYVFNQVLNQTNLGVVSGAGIAPSTLSIAILYEQNTFGESSAVATAQAAMAQGIAISEYASFPADNPSIEQLTTLAGAARDQNPTLVYLISSNPDTAEALVGTLQASYAANNSLLPVVLGQAGAFTSQSFLKSQNAQGVYVLRQRWNKVDCPSELTSYYAAQSYGAVYLLNYAVGLTNEVMLTGQKWYLNPSATDDLAKFRETLRDKLKAASVEVPCIGNVAFDTTGQNKSIEFEILSLDNGNSSIVASSDFLKLVIDHILGMSPSD